MYKIFKKVSCLALAVVLFVSLFAGMDLKVSAATKWESESNDTYSTADNITLGNTARGNLKNYEDKDYYKFVPSANGKVDINFLHEYESSSRGSWVIAVYLYENAEYLLITEHSIAENDNERVALPYIGAVKGKTYYIEIYTYSSYLDGVEYSISTSFTASEYYEKEFNDKYSTASALFWGKTYKGNLKDYADKDHYKFTASANGKIDITFSHVYENENGYSNWVIDVYLYENGEYSLITEQSVAQDDNERVVLPYIGAVKGKTYYIKIYTYSSYLDGVEYSISTSFTASEYYEKEFNDKYSTATSVVVEKTYKGILDDSNDKDYYRINSQITGKLKLTFGHIYEENSSFWEVFIYQYTNGEYRQLCVEEIYLEDKTVVTLPNVNIKSGGTYYVVVNRGCSNDDIIGKEYIIKASYLLYDVSNVKATPKKKAIKLTWKKEKGMAYQVQIKDGKWKTAKTTTGNKCTIKKLKAKKSYKVRIRGYKKVNGVTYYSAWKTVKVKTK